VSQLTRTSDGNPLVFDQSILRLPISDVKKLNDL
jgi:hypothetical protein